MNQSDSRTSFSSKIALFKLKNLTESFSLMFLISGVRDTKLAGF
jgi:hypothetical protein